MGFLAENAGAISQGSGMLSTIAGSMISAQGERQAGKAAAQADLFNSSVAATNSEIALQNATFAGHAGQAEMGIEGMKTAAALGGLKAGQAASGVDINSASAVNVRASESAKGMLDALMIQSNAAKQAYGFQTDSADYTAQSANFKNQAVFDRQAGNIKARATLLSGVSQAGKGFSDYMLQNSITGKPAAPARAAGKSQEARGGEALV